MFANHFSNPSATRHVLCLSNSDQKYCWAPKGETESSPELRQVIPYIMLQRPDDRICVYRRKGSEQRLAGKLSIGFGGHVEITDDDTARSMVKRAPFWKYRSSYETTVAYAAFREFVEECHYAAPSPFSKSVDPDCGPFFTYGDNQYHIEELPSLPGIAAIFDKFAKSLFGPRFFADRDFNAYELVDSSDDVSKAHYGLARTLRLAHDYPLSFSPETEVLGWFTPAELSYIKAFHATFPPHLRDSTTLLKFHDSLLVGRRNDSVFLALLSYTYNSLTDKKYNITPVLTSDFEIWSRLCIEQYHFECVDPENNVLPLGE